EHTEWRGKKNVVTELVDEDFPEHHRKRRHVAEPMGFRAVEEIDQGSVKSPNRDRERQVAKILHLETATLKKQNQENLRQDPSGKNGRANNECQSVRTLEFSEIAQCLCGHGIRIKRNRQPEHDCLDNERRPRVRPRRLPSNYQCAWRSWHPTGSSTVRKGLPPPPRRPRGTRRLETAVIASLFPRNGVAPGGSAGITRSAAAEADRSYQNGQH